MEKTRYTSEPEPVLAQRQNGYLGITVNVNITKLDPEPIEGDTHSEDTETWEADCHFFWEKEENIDLDAVIADPEAFLYYVPLSVRQKGKDAAQALLDDLRNGTPIIPVPSYRADAAVCNRPADQVKLLAGLSMGGLPYYELASGEVVSLSAADIQAIAIDITQAETLMQQGKQECWAVINAAKGQEDIDKALADYKALLKEFGAK